MKTFLVVGMHRSATSLVAKGLHEAGVHMGDNLLGAMPSNLDGHYEDKQAIKINDHILKVAGGAWDNPPDHHAIDMVQYDLSEYLRHRSEHDLWGLKDPRLSLTWPVWLRQMPWDVHVVWVRRRADEVVKSLMKRNGMSARDAAILSETYIGRISLLMETVYGGY